MMLMLGHGDLHVHVHVLGIIELLVSCEIDKGMPRASFSSAALKEEVGLILASRASTATRNEHRRQVSKVRRVWHGADIRDLHFNESVLVGSRGDCRRGFCCAVIGGDGRSFEIMVCA